MLTLLLILPLLGVICVTISNNTEIQKQIALIIILINSMLSLVL